MKHERGDERFEEACVDAGFEGTKEVKEEIENAAEAGEYEQILRVHAHDHSK